MKGIQENGVSGHQDVEEVPERRQGLVLGGVAPRELVQEPAGPAGGDLVQLQSLVLTPGEEPSHLVGVGGPGVGVGEPRGEELVRREAGHLSGSYKDGREGPFEVRFGERIGGFGDEFLSAHPRLFMDHIDKSFQPGVFVRSEPGFS